MKKILSVVTIMLAMVLCFTGCDELEDFQHGVEGYNNNASQSQANANAKIVYVAVSNFISENPDVELQWDGGNFYLPTSDKEGTYYFTFDDEENTYDLSAYLGKKFKGYSYIQLDYDDYDNEYVTVAIWTDDWEAMEAIGPYVDGPLTTSELEDYQNMGYTIGCYPIAPEDNYFDY